MLNKSTYLHFFSNAAHLTPGMVLEADGSMLNDLEAGITSQTAMFDQRLKPLNEMIHFHGPQSMAFSSGVVANEFWDLMSNLKTRSIRCIPTHS